MSEADAETAERLFTNESITEALSELFRAGRAKVLRSGREHAFRTSFVEASIAAMRRSGCEVRIFCKDLEECVFVHGILDEVHRRHGTLDARRTRLLQIELINGSCIMIKKEDAAPIK